MNFLLDVNVVIDILSEDRRKKFPESEYIYNFLNKKNADFFVSSSSLDNLEFILIREIKNNINMATKEAKRLSHLAIKYLLKYVKIAKTPSYIELDYEDIEDSQIVASAKAIDAKIITRDRNLLQKYPDLTLSPKEFLPKIENEELNIDFANINRQYFRYYSEIEEAVDKVYNHSKYIMGPEISELEENLCKFTNAKNAITCSSGTDALLLAMMALDVKEGDEVITTPFTFIATAETIALLKAKPVFVDIDEKTYNIDVNKIEEKITDKTKAIIAVSLYGQPCDLEELNSLTHPSTHQPIYLIIDGAQSFGATYKDKAEVHYCDIYTTSFFPAKPLGCYGDGGAVLTNNNELAEKIKMLRVHGQNKRYHHKYIGLGARLDTIQAAILNVKLKHYKKDLALRQEVAEKYTNQFKIQNPKLVLPFVKNDRTSAWAQYSIRVKNKEEIQDNLKEAGIPTAIHYPMPLHLQECFAYLGYKKGDFPMAEKISKEIMSLPMNPDLSDEEIEYISEKMDFNTLR